MSWGLETGGPVAPDPGTCRAGSSRQLWIYAPSPQHLPLPPTKGNEHPHRLAPRKQTAGGSPCQPQQNTGPAPRRDGTRLGAGTQHPSPELGCAPPLPGTPVLKGHGCQAAIPLLLLPASTPTAAGSQLRAGCCWVVPRPCPGDIWGHLQHGCQEPMPPRAGGCLERVGTQQTRVPRADGCQGQWVQERGVPGSGVAGAGGEWQGLVWPLPSPTGVSKGQRLGIPQLFLEQRGFQKKLPPAISGWALIHPWLDARGCVAPATAAPQPVTTLLGRHRSCPHPSLPHGPPGTARSPRQPPKTNTVSSLGCLHPAAGLTCVPRGAWQGQDWWGTGHRAPSHMPWQPRLGCPYTRNRSLGMCSQS